MGERVILADLIFTKLLKLICKDATNNKNKTFLLLLFDNVAHPRVLITTN